MVSYATCRPWFASRKVFDRLFAAIFSRVFQPGGEGAEALGPLVREGLSLGCASHLVCRTLGAVRSIRNALDKFVQFVFDQRNGNAKWWLKPDDPLLAHTSLETGKTLRDVNNSSGKSLVHLLPY